MARYDVALLALFLHVSQKRHTNRGAGSTGFYSDGDFKEPKEYRKVFYSERCNKDPYFFCCSSIFPPVPSHEMSPEQCALRNETLEPRTQFA